MERVTTFVNYALRVLSVLFQLISGVVCIVRCGGFGTFIGVCTIILGIYVGFKLGLQIWQEYHS